MSNAVLDRNGLSQNGAPTSHQQDPDVDGADSVEGASKAEVEDVVEPTAESPPIGHGAAGESTRRNFCLFDDGASRMCLRNVPVSCGLCLL